jgi:hypothetical protein
MLTRVLVGSVGVIAVAALALWSIVWPPAPLARPEQGAVLDGVTLIEPSATRREGMRLAIEGSRIAAIEPAGAAPSGPYAGAFVLPGLVDLHVHFPPPTLPGQTELFAFLHLYHGVLAVRDAGDVDGQSTAPAQRGVEEGRFPGPRVVACGPYVDGSSALWRNSLVARNPDEGRDAVRKVAEAGFSCVKAYNELDAPTLVAIREEAHARGLPVIGHVPWRVPFEAARLDDAQHGIGVPPPLPPQVRFPQVLRGWLELDDARLDAIVQASLEHRIAHTPTLVTIDRLAAQEDRAAVLLEGDARYMPGFYRDVVWNPDGGISAAGALAPDEFGMVRAALRTHQRVVNACSTPASRSTPAATVWSRSWSRARACTASCACSPAPVSRPSRRWRSPRASRRARSASKGSVSCVRALPRSCSSSARIRRWTSTRSTACWRWCVTGACTRAPTSTRSSSATARTTTAPRTTR